MFDDPAGDSTIAIFHLFLVCVRARVSCTLIGFSHMRASHPEVFQGLELMYVLQSILCIKW